ncbi:MAG: type II toxin-antitoxin system VapC family toxin [Microcystis aeruginosa Ma_QC_C_20070703_M131]|uniref:Type II toxin-antitoxin system VapC family toxin n=1 Tax=Microcystis aeruginosa Ma_QC_C_20070703_M131 TaxID=2486263 RepID=A0A551YLV5_MICAE|nr:MAG: type II toxin-antitoxin system VapC family toxin [Microcystis aeruginosa Ma_QC_C_20070703_M131]
MKILMDTHAFLWFIEGDNNLSDAARSLIENNQYQKRLSIASLWEMSIKASLNRLELKITFPNLIQNYVYNNGFDILSINAEHLEQLKRLPYYHKDPFDRLIIAQSLTENIPILTKDELFKRYTENLLW